MTINKKSFLIDFSICAWIIYITTRDFDILNQITVLNDEFGYWSIAATWAGKHWNDLIQITPYYNFGYSIILYPLVMLFSNPIILYHSAIIVNIILVLCNYFFLIKIIEKLYNSFDYKIIKCISFLLCLYPSILYNSQIAWTETLLNTLYLLIIFLMVSELEKPSKIKQIFIVLFVIFIFMVHQRSFVIAMALIISLFFRNKKRSKIIITFISISLGFALATLAKSILVDTLWNNSSYSEMNSISKSVSVSLLKFIIQNIGIFLLSLKGKLVYYLLVGGPFFLAGLFTSAKIIYLGILKKQNKEQYYMIKIFLFMSFILSFGINVVATLNFDRLDKITYSRYSEYTILPILLIGMCEILANKFQKSFYMIYFVITLLISLEINKVFVNSTSNNFNVTCSPGLGWIFNNFHDKNTAFLFGVILIVHIIVLITVLYVHLDAKNSRSIYKYLFLTVVGIGWMLQFLFSRSYLNEWRVRINTVCYEMMPSIIDKYDIDEIYFLKDQSIDPYCLNAKHLQFTNSNLKINIINIDELSKSRLNSGSIYIVEKKADVPENIKEGYITLIDADIFFVYIVE